MMSPSLFHIDTALEAHASFDDFMQLGYFPGLTTASPLSIGQNEDVLKEKQIVSY